MPSTHAKTCEDQNSLAIAGPGLVLVLLALSPFVPFLLAARLFGGLEGFPKAGAASLHDVQPMSSGCRSDPEVQHASLRLPCRYGQGSKH